MTFIILVVIAVVLFVGIDAMVHPEKREKARADIQRRKEEKKKKPAPEPTTYRKTFEVVSEDRKYAVIESRFNNKEFWEDERYSETARQLVNDEMMDEGDVVYKWQIKPLGVRCDLKEDSIDVYATADGSEYEYIGYIPDVTKGDKRLFDGGELYLNAQGSTGKELLYNLETDRYRLGKEQYYPWSFSVRVVKVVRNG